MIILPALALVAVIALVLSARRGRYVKRGLGSVAAGMATVAAVSATILGGDGVDADLAVPVLILVALPLAGLAFALKRGSAVVTDAPWPPPPEGQTGIAGPNRPDGVPARSVARALGRVEARDLAVSPWFGVGLGFCVLIFVLFGLIWADEEVETWVEAAQSAAWLAHPLVGMAVLAGHRAVTRAARDGADEIFEGCPTSPSTRTAGFLLAGLVPVAALALFFAVMGTTAAVRSHLLHGPLGAGILADLAAAVVLGAGGLALGVALGRWVRFALAPVVTLVAVLLAVIALNSVGGSGWNPLVPLSTARSVDGPSPVFADRPVFWHLAWLVGLTGGVAVVALARHRRDRAVALAGAAAAFVVLAAGIGATRPLPPGSAARIADLVANPAAHQECATTDGPVEVCVFPFHRQLLDRVTDQVGPIAAVLPSAAAPLTLRQVYDGDLDDLPPEVRRRLSQADLMRPPGEVPLGFGQELNDVPGGPGFDAAFAAAGLPTEADDQLVPTVVAGQARGVVALWLATRGLDSGDATRASTANDPGSGDAFTRGSVEDVDDPCTAPAVVWSAQDLTATRAVIALPETTVARVVGDGWAHWTDPATGTDELLTALGLPTIGPFDRVQPRPGNSC